MVITLESIQFLLSFVSLRRKLAISVPGSGGGSWTAWKLFVFCRLLYGVVYCVWAGVINRNTERRRWGKTGEAHITLLLFPTLQKEKLWGLVGLGTLKHYSIFLFYSWLILLAILDLLFLPTPNQSGLSKSFKDLARYGKPCNLESISIPIYLNGRTPWKHVSFWNLPSILMGSFLSYFFFCTFSLIYNFVMWLIILESH